MTKNRNYHLHLGETVYCTKIITEATKGKGQRDRKRLPRIILFLTVGSPHRNRQRMRCILVQTLLKRFKQKQNYYERIPL